MSLFDKISEANATEVTTRFNGIYMYGTRGKGSVVFAWVVGDALYLVVGWEDGAITRIASSDLVNYRWKAP